jgi:hypothetical protein
VRNLSSRASWNDELLVHFHMYSILLLPSMWPNSWETPMRPPIRPDSLRPENVVPCRFPVVDDVGQRIGNLSLVDCESSGAVPLKKLRRL